MTYRANGLCMHDEEMALFIRLSDRHDLSPEGAATVFLEQSGFECAIAIDQLDAECRETVRREIAEHVADLLRATRRQ